MSDTHISWLWIQLSSNAIEINCKSSFDLVSIFEIIHVSSMGEWIFSHVWFLVRLFAHKGQMTFVLRWVKIRVGQIVLQKKSISSMLFSEFWGHFWNFLPWDHGSISYS